MGGGLNRKRRRQFRKYGSLFYLALALAEVGRTAEARHYADEAIERDPLTWMTPFGRSVVDLFDGQFDAAVARFQEWIARLTPDLPLSQWWLAQALAYAGREDEAIVVFERSARSNAGLFSDWCELGARAFRGERENARAWFESKENLQQAAISGETYPRYLSMCFARVAEYDLALRWLEQAIRWGFTNQDPLRAPRGHGAARRTADGRFRRGTMRFGGEVENG